MTIGPVQVLVLGFDNPEFSGQILQEIERLHDAGTLRVIDALVVHRDREGGFEVEQISNLTEDEAIEVGAAIGALVGLGSRGSGGIDTGAALGAEAAAGGISVFTDEDAWDVLGDIPEGSSGALILLEHHWAAGLRSAVVHAGGHLVSEGFMTPADFVGVGQATQDEVSEIETLRRTGPPAPGRRPLPPRRAGSPRSLIRRG